MDAPRRRIQEGGRTMVEGLVALYLGLFIGVPVATGILWKWALS